MNSNYMYIKIFFNVFVFNDNLIIFGKIMTIKNLHECH